MFNSVVLEFPSPCEASYYKLTAILCLASQLIGFPSPCEASYYKFTKKNICKLEVSFRPLARLVITNSRRDEEQGLDIALFPSPCEASYYKFDKENAVSRKE